MGVRARLQGAVLGVAAAAGSMAVVSRDAHAAVAALAQEVQFRKLGWPVAPAAAAQPAPLRLPSATPNFKSDAHTRHKACSVAATLLLALRA